MVTLRRMVLTRGPTLSRVMAEDEAMAIIETISQKQRHATMAVLISTGRVPDEADLNVAFNDDLPPQNAADALIAAGQQVAMLHGLTPGKPKVASSPEFVYAVRITAEKWVDFCRSGTFGTGDKFRFDQTRERCVDELTHAMLAALVYEHTRLAEVGQVDGEER